MGKGLPAVPTATATTALPSMRTAAAADKKEKSAWKRGVERLWRSKSASALRDSARRSENDTPPVPALPKEHVGLSGATQHVPLSGPLAYLGSPSPNPISPPLPTAPLPTTTSSALGIPYDYPSRPNSAIPHDDPIRQQLDVRFPSFTARSAPRPSTFAEETYADDPFASAVDYAMQMPGRPSSRGGGGRSPLPPDFSPPPIPETYLPDGPRGSPSLTNLKASIIPRLRKSRSMAMANRPNSLVGLFGHNDRRKTPTSPGAMSPGLAIPTTYAIDEMVLAGSASSDVLEPPHPLFYDTFELASSGDDSSDKDGDKEEEQAAYVQDEPPVALPPWHAASEVAVGTTRRTSFLAGDLSLDTVEHLHTGLPSPPIAEVSMPMSAPPRDIRQAPELSIETEAPASSTCGHSAELVTPGPMSAPPHVTQYAEFESPMLQQKHTRSSSLMQTPVGPVDSPSFQDLYQQLGMWPVESAAATDEDVATLANRSVESAVPPGDDFGRLVIANPDPLSSPTRSSASTHPSDTTRWSAVVNAFLNIDDPVSASATSLDYTYHSGLDYADAVSVADLNSVLEGLDFGSTTSAGRARGSLGSQHSVAVAVAPTDATSHSTSDSPHTTRTMSGRAQVAPEAPNSGHFTSWRDVPRRREGSQGSSRDSSRERPRRLAPTDGGAWLEVDSESSDDGEEELDDMPLSRLHPAAGAAQQQRLAEAVRRREARRAERERDLRSTKRDVVAREQRTPTSRQASIRDPHSTAQRRDWNGEGAVPADMLAGRLERVAVSSKSSNQPSSSSSSSQQQRIPTTAPLDLSRARSAAGQAVRPPRPNRPARPDDLSSSAPMSRIPTAGASTSHSNHTSSSSQLQQQQSSRPSSRNQQQRAVSDSRDLRERPDSDHPSRAPSAASTNTFVSAMSSHSPATSVSAGTGSIRRPRAVSNPREREREQPSLPVPDVPALPSPSVAAPRRGQPVRVIVVSAEGEGKLLPFEVHHDTTARDVLARAREQRDIADIVTGPTTGWVVFEQYAELGLERQLREYEHMAQVMRGWDPRAKANCFVVRESHMASATWAKVSVISKATGSRRP